MPGSKHPGARATILKCRYVKTSDGTRREFQPGEVLFQDDVADSPAEKAPQHESGGLPVTVTCSKVLEVPPISDCCAQFKRERRSCRPPLCPSLWGSTKKAPDGSSILQNDFHVRNELYMSAGILGPSRQLHLQVSNQPRSRLPPPHKWNNCQINVQERWDQSPATRWCCRSPPLPTHPPTYIDMTLQVV